MIRLRLLSPVLAAAWIAGGALGAGAKADPELLARGRALVASHCAGCHAIDRSGSSPHREAPPFRTLSRRYPIEFLAEALGEGLMTGHPDMPEFVFDSEDVGAILAYLQSIQEQTAPGR